MPHLALALAILGYLGLTHVSVCRAQAVGATAATEADLAAAFDAAIAAMRALEQSSLRGDATAQDEAGLSLAAALRQLRGLRGATLSDTNRSELDRLLAETRAALYWLQQMRLRRQHFAEGGQADDGSESVISLNEGVAVALLAKAGVFAREHADELPAIRDRYLVLIEEYPDTLAAFEAEDELERLVSGASAKAVPATSRAEPPPAADRRPYWERVEARLQELEPGETGEIRARVRSLLLSRDYVQAFDCARRALAATNDLRERSLLQALVGELESALAILSQAIMSAPSLVGRTHVFRMSSGTSYAGNVLSWDGSSFRLQTTSGEDLPISIQALSPRGLCQVATAEDQPAAYAAASMFFLLLGDFESMDHYLDLARQRQAQTANLEVAAAVARERALLEKELPAARAAWKKIGKSYDTFLKSLARQDYRRALTKLKEALPLLRDEDLPALDELALERVQAGLVSLLDEARGSCPVKHADARSNLVRCATCDGEGTLHDSQGRNPSDPEARRIQCPACRGKGLSPCTACADRLEDPELREFHLRAMRVLGGQ